MRARVCAGWPAIWQAGLAILVLTSPAFAAPGAGLPAAPPPGPTAVRPLPSASDYHISSGDLVSIMVWGEDRFSRECEVNGSGTISYPLLGDVAAAGVTCAELEARLGEGLQRYLKRPRVTVTVSRYGALGMNVFVLGEVKAPGAYPLATGGGLMQALAAAGGETRLASGEIEIVKARTGELRRTGLEAATPGGRVTPEAMLEPGDVVVVKRKPEADEERRYAVLGEVPRPGMFELPAEGEVRVLDGIEKAGLLSVSPEPGGEGGGRAPGELARTADLEHALLTRGEVSVPLDLAALLRGDTSQNLLLQAGDVLTVPRRSLVTVYAMGEVRRPGRQSLPLNSTLMDLLNAVEGVTSGASLSGATLLRVVEGKPNSVGVNLERLLRRGEAKENLSLEQGDVLFVPAKGERRQDAWRFLPILPYLLRY